jgi:ferredoxin-NADP reductase
LPTPCQPGQYVGIAVAVDGRFHWRSYSLTSAPAHHQGHITITVKAMPEGLLSEHLVRGVESGTIVRLAPPRGEFVLPDPPPAKLRVSSSRPHHAGDRLACPDLDIGR